MRLNLLLLLTIIVNLAAFAAVPPMVNYQGKLTKTDGTLLPDGTYSMTYAIYDVATNGVAIWSEINPAVQVKKGLFSVLLGSIHHLPDDIFNGTDRYFGVTVGTDPEMTPRQQIASVPFAFRAASAGTVDDGTITKAKLAPDATSEISDVLKTGWVPADEIWTYASATTINVSNGADLKYSVGDKLRFKQGASFKYFYITEVGNSSLTITGGSDYSLVNAVISDNYYSKSLSPIGFPANSNTFSPIGVNYAQVTVNQGGITTVTDLTGLSITCNIPSGKRIKITGYVCITANSNMSSAWLTIREGTNQYASAVVSLPYTSVAPTCIVQCVISPTPGVHTYKLCLQLGAVGTGTISIDAGPTYPSYIIAEIV